MKDGTPQGPVSVETAPHYSWGAGCDGWHLLRSAELSVIEERMPAGSSEQRHRHARAQQFFYVLEGELTMDREGYSDRVGAGEGIRIAPGEPHQARNAGFGEVRFLVVSQPPSHGDRIDG